MPESNKSIITALTKEKIEVKIEPKEMVSCYVKTGQVLIYLCSAETYITNINPGDRVVYYKVWTNVQIIRILRIIFEAVIMYDSTSHEENIHNLLT